MPDSGTIVGRYHPTQGTFLYAGRLMATNQRGVRRHSFNFPEPDFWVFEVVNRGIGDDTAKAVSLPHFPLLASMLPSQYWAWMATTRITYCFLFPDGRSR